MPPGVTVMRMLFVLLPEVNPELVSATSVSFWQETDGTSQKPFATHGSGAAFKSL